MWKFCYKSRGRHVGAYRISDLVTLVDIIQAFEKSEPHGTASNQLSMLRRDLNCLVEHPQSCIDGNDDDSKKGDNLELSEEAKHAALQLKAHLDRQF